MYNLGKCEISIFGKEFFTLRIENRKACLKRDQVTL